MRRSLQVTGGVETLFGTLDENLKFLESSLHVTIDLRDDQLVVEGERESVERASRIVEEYNQLVREGRRFRDGEVKSLLRLATEEPNVPLKELLEPKGGAQRHAMAKKSVTPRSANQRRYME